MLLRGAFRDRLVGPRRPPVEGPWRPNLVVWSALDLIGLLLCSRTQGVTFLAVGAGDPAWDDEAPEPDRSRTGLENELYRVRLDPGAALAYDPAKGELQVHASIGPGKATGTLRELGLFGGDASPRPGSGTLVNHGVHPALQKAADDTLERDLVLTLEEALPAGARELVGRLLAREPGLAGLTHVALGTDAGAPADPAQALAAEAYRKRLDPHRLAYDAEAHTVEASATFEIAEGPADVREAGLFGGTASDAAGTGLLVARDTATPVDRREPKRLEQQFRLVLVERTGIAVPALVGETLAAAREALAAAGLQPGPVSTLETDAGPPGTVLEQAPAAATVVNEGARVTLVVATQTVTVPELVGAQEDQARALLAQLGLTVPDDERVEQQSAAPSGTVLAASPPPGARVQKGTGVALTVAVPILALVPDLRGRTPAAAAVVLGAVGLTLAPEPRPTQESGASPGSIVAQSPAPQTDAPVGTAVQITVATPVDGRDPRPGGDDARRRRRGARRSGGRSDRDAGPADVAGGADARRGRGARRSGGDRHDHRAVAARRRACLPLRDGRRRRRQPRRRRPRPLAHRPDADGCGRGARRRRLLRRGGVAAGVRCDAGNRGRPGPAAGLGLDARRSRRPDARRRPHGGRPGRRRLRARRRRPR